MTSKLSIKEAAFFLELLHALEQRSDSLTNQASAAEEAGFLFAAILNAFHSCLDMLGDREPVDLRKSEAISSFRASHPEIYHSGLTRAAKTAHKAHVVSAGGRGALLPGGRSGLVSRHSPKLSTSKTGRRSTDLRSRDGYQIFLQTGSDLVRAIDYYDAHLVQLREFHDSFTTP